MNKCFIVMGMHSSATSLVAEGMHRAGVRMWLNKSNSKWEDLDIMSLNDKILSRAGGTWYEPPDKNSIETLQDDVVEDINRAVSERNAQGVLWGAKDPRFALTWTLWRNVLDLSQIHLITVNRDTEETAESCRRRKKNGYTWSIQQWITLVEEYKTRMREYV